MRVSTGDATASYACWDVDECAESPCAQHCRNTPGSFECACAEGYLPTGEGGRDCAEICREPGTRWDAWRKYCVRSGGGEEEVPFQEEGDVSRSLEAGSGPAPGGSPCPARGYRQVEDGSCQDVDECSEDETERPAGCTHFCLNTIGSFECLCDFGYELDPADNATCVYLCNGGDPAGEKIWTGPSMGCVWKPEVRRDSEFIIFHAMLLFVTN